MVIYLDVLIAVNFVITYFSLKATARLLHAGYGTWRLIAASAFGGVSSVSAVTPLGFIGSFLMKTALTAVIVIIAFGFGGISPFIFRTLLTAVSGALVCGFTIMLRELTGSSFFAAAGGYPYLDISVLHLIIATVAVYAFISLYRRIIDRPDNGEIIRLVIKKDGNTAEITAFPDSGNNLRDFLTGLPVIVCRKDKLKNIMPDFSENRNGIRLIPFSSVGGNGVITAFRADSIDVYRENGQKTQIDALIGADDNSLKNESFDAVINPRIIV